MPVDPVVAPDVLAQVLPAVPQFSLLDGSLSSGPNPLITCLGFFLSLALCLLLAWVTEGEILSALVDAGLHGVLEHLSSGSGQRNKNIC